MLVIVCSTKCSACVKRNLDFVLLLPSQTRVLVVVGYSSTIPRKHAEIRKPIRDTTCCSDTNNLEFRLRALLRS